MKKYCKSLFFIFVLSALTITPSLNSYAMEMDSEMTHMDSPRKQMKMGVDIHQIQCKSGHELVFKSTNWSPACVKSSSVARLVEIGWASDHIPSADEMMQDHMMK